MTTRQEELGRSILFYASLMIAAGVTNEEIVNFLQANNIPERMIRIIANIALYSSAYAHNWLESRTVEYQQLLNLKNEVLKSAKKLFIGLEKTDPIESFALYNVLYRGGYLSLNHKFEFSSQSMDFGKLEALDVILGQAVCRSISDLYVSICNELEMKAKSIFIHVNHQTFAGAEAFPQIPIQVNDQVNETLEKILMSLPLGNHVISLVEKEEAFYLDPTNITMFNKKEGNRLFIEGAKGDAYVCHIQKFLSLLERRMNVSLFTPQTNVSYEECLETYRKAFDDVQKNMDSLEAFYLENQGLYQEIAGIAHNQHSYLKRKLPMFPIK